MNCMDEWNGIENSVWVIDGLMQDCKSQDDWIFTRAITDAPWRVAIRKQMKLSPLRPSVKQTAQVLLSEQYGNDITLCKKCKQGHMVVVASIFAGQIRDGPEEIIQRWKKLWEKTVLIKYLPLRLPENIWSKELCLVIFKKNKILRTMTSYFLK